MKEYLVCNDDGIYAPGIAALAQVVGELGKLHVVAPSGNCSGYSSALTLDRPIRANDIKPGWISVDGTPADCVHLGINTLVSPEPDMVVAGINAGANLGDDVLYSGTVAAALEGRFLGKPAIAVSLVEGKHHGSVESYRSAAEVVRRLLQHWDEIPLAAGALLNVNVPPISLADIKGLKITTLGHRSRVEHVQETHDPRGNKAYWIGLAGTGDHCGPGTDFHAISEGYVSVTPLHADMTKHEARDDLGAWLQNI